MGIAIKMKKFMIIPLFIILTTTAFSEDKIYTNEDLKPEPPTDSNSIFHMRTSFNPSFAELHRYIEVKLTEIKIPQYKVYLRPLSPEMTKLSRPFVEVERTPVAYPKPQPPFCQWIFAARQQ
jgi:hypothetical protein